MDNQTKKSINTDVIKKIDKEQVWKKIRALTHFSQTLREFKDWMALEFIIVYFKDNQLDEHQCAFLDYVLAKHNIDYLQWCYKNEWVQDQIKNGTYNNQPAEQFQLWFPDLHKKSYESRFKMPIYSNLIRNKLVYLEKR